MSLYKVILLQQVYMCQWKTTTKIKSTDSIVLKVHVC